MADNTISRAEMIEIVKRLMAGAGTDDEEDADIERLRAAAPHPSPTDFFADASRDWTVEEIVDAILAYKPIVPPGTPSTAED